MKIDKQTPKQKWDRIAADIKAQAKNARNPIMIFKRKDNAIR